MRTPLRLLPALAVLLCGCASSPAPVHPSADGSSGEAGESSDEASTGSIADGITPLLDACSGPDDPMSIEAVEHEGSTLSVTVAHGGGCEEHTYQACWNGALAKSLPPQATLELRHDAHGDACKAGVTKTLTIDVSSVIEQASGSVVIHVGDQRVRLEE